MRQIRFILIFFIPLTIFSGCNYCNPKKITNQGIIEYSIAYDDSLKPNFNKNLLPNRFIVMFNDSNSLNKIEGLSGAVTISFISNNENRTRLVLIKLLNKKLYYQESIDSTNAPNAFAGMPKITITPDRQSIDYKGYKCFKASAYFNDKNNTPFEIIYTNDIKVKSPNANTPFESIDGVMLKFKVMLYNRPMTMSAIKFTATSVSKEEFVTPSGYEKVDRKTFEDVISLLQ